MNEVMSVRLGLKVAERTGDRDLVKAQSGQRICCHLSVLRSELGGVLSPQDRELCLGGRKCALPTLETFAGFEQGCAMSDRCMAPPKGVEGKETGPSPRRLNKGARRVLGSELQVCQLEALSGGVEVVVQGDSREPVDQGVVDGISSTQL